MSDFTDTNIDPEPEPEKNGFERRQAVKERDYRFRAAALIRAEWSDEQLQTELDALTKPLRTGSRLVG